MLIEKRQAIAELYEIKSLISKLDSDDEETVSTAATEISESPISIEVKSDWHSIDEAATHTEYQIILCTGGPAVRITGRLDDDNEPITAKLQYQGWFTEWQDLSVTADETEILLRYALHFYYGQP